MKTYRGMPGIWKVSDFVAFGLGGVVCIGLLMFGLVSGFEGDASSVKQVPFLLAACAAGFLFVYWQAVKVRINELRGFVLVGDPKYGLLVNMGSYEPVGEDLYDLVELVEKTVDDWSRVWPRERVEEALSSGYVWIWFKEGDLDLPYGRPGKVAGFTVLRKIHVGYIPGSTFRKTAFAHELGHVIQGLVTGSWSQDEHHARSKEHGIR